MAQTRWWLSFCDGDKPKNHQFLGVCIIQGDRFLDAVMTSHRLGINPGGEVAGFPLPPSHEDNPPLSMDNRLLTRAEADAYGHNGDADPEAHEQALRHATQLCQDCHHTHCDC